MNRRPLLLAAPLLIAPLCAQAQEQHICPWLTEGTAAAVLGGSTVSSTVKVPTDGESPEGSCTFASQQGALRSTLEIVVTRAPNPACPTGSPKLPGIGNEAAACRVDGPVSGVRYAIDSRVRDLYLSTSLTIQGVSPNSKSVVTQQQQLERVAEQVAGNLY